MRAKAKLSSLNDKDDLPVQPSGGGPVGCGCAVLLGIFVSAAAIWSMSWFEIKLPEVAIASIVCVVFGICGYRYGDRFFVWILDKLR